MSLQTCYKKLAVHPDDVSDRMLALKDQGFYLPVAESAPRLRPLLLTAPEAPAEEEQSDGDADDHLRAPSSWGLGAPDR